MARRQLQEMNTPVKFRLRELFQGCFHLEFASQREMTSTLMRIQEYYESPKFRGKAFSVEEFVSWYRRRKSGRFTYFQDWSGFNFPSSVLDVFRSGAMGALTKREQIILQRLPKSGKFYIIATFRSTKQAVDLITLRHELAHALFFLDSKYRGRCQRILRPIKLTPMYQYLRELGYHRAVFTDEVQAYFASVDESLESALDLDPYRKVIDKINRLFEQVLRTRQQ